VEGKFHPLHLTSSSRLCTVCRAELFRYFVFQFKPPSVQSSMSDLQPKPSKTDQRDTNLYLQVTRVVVCYLWLWFAVHEEQQWEI